MRQPPMFVFIAIAVVLVLGVILIPRPWNDLLSFFVMVGLFAFVTMQERRTGRSAGVIKWLALGLALFDLYLIYSFFAARGAAA